IVEQEIGTLVGGEPSRESEREDRGVQTYAHRRRLVRWQAHDGNLLHGALAGVVDEDLARGGTETPQLGVRRARRVALDRLRRLAPPLRSARLRPQRVRLRGLP